ncbi:hypothetical protein M2317_000641 [Microbacterium sp. ZKA21]
MSWLRRAATLANRLGFGTATPLASYRDETAWWDRAADA